MLTRKLVLAVLAVISLFASATSVASSQETFQGDLADGASISHFFTTTSSGDITINLDWAPGLRYCEETGQLGTWSQWHVCWTRVNGDGILRAELEWDPLADVAGNPIYSNLDLEVLDGNAKVVAANNDVNPLSGSKELSKSFSGLTPADQQFVWYRIKGTLGTTFRLRTWSPKTAMLWLHLYDAAGNRIATSMPPGQRLFNETDVLKPQSVVVRDMPAGSYRVRVDADFASAPYDLTIDHS